MIIRASPCEHVTVCVFVHQHNPVIICHDLLYLREILIADNTLLQQDLEQPSSSVLLTPQHPAYKQCRCIVAPKLPACCMPEVLFQTSWLMVWCTGYSALHQEQFPYCCCVSMNVLHPWACMPTAAQPLILQASTAGRS